MTLRYNMHGEIVDEYLLFFIIIATVFIVPNLLRKFNVPAITSIMLAGILIGPYGLNILQIDENEWNELIEWGCEMMRKFENTFSRFLSKCP